MQRLIETEEITADELFRLANAVAWRRSMQNKGVAGVSQQHSEWKQVSAFGYVQNPDAFGTARMVPRNPTYHARAEPTQIDLFSGTASLTPRKEGT